jgi:putative acetyltransferase
MVSIREEIPSDTTAVRIVLEEAFGQPAEANIVEKLRESCDELLALVAVEDEAVVGHILFSPVEAEGSDGVVRGMGLAPMAVTPECRRRGIGSALVEHGLVILRERDCPFVIVLGHPEYYPRFGFELASRHGLNSQWEGVPDEAFMVLVLNAGVLDGVRGVVKYRKEFDEAI